MNFCVIDASKSTNSTSLHTNTEIDVYVDDVVSFTCFSYIICEIDDSTAIKLFYLIGCIQTISFSQHLACAVEIFDVIKIRIFTVIYCKVFKASIPSKMEC